MYTLSGGRIFIPSLFAFARIAVHQCTLSRVQQGCGSPGVGSQELRRAQCCHLLQTAVQVKSEFEARRPRDGPTQRARPRRAAAAPPPHRSKAYATAAAPWSPPRPGSASSTRRPRSATGLNCEPENGATPASRAMLHMSSTAAYMSTASGSSARITDWRRRRRT